MILLLLVFLGANVAFSHLLAKRHYRVAAVAHLISFFVFAFVFLFSGFYPSVTAFLCKLVGVQYLDWIPDVLRQNLRFFAPFSVAVFAVFLQTLVVLTEVTVTPIIRFIRHGAKIWILKRKKSLRVVRFRRSDFRSHTILCYFLCVMRC